MGDPVAVSGRSASLEGIVSKKKDSRYTAGETDLWQRTKACQEGGFNGIGVKERDDRSLHALFAQGRVRMGAPIVSLKAKQHDA